MSTPSIADYFDPETFRPFTFFHSPELLKYAITHVFLPIELPDNNDYAAEKDFSLAHAMWATACVYTPHLSGTSQTQWHHITKMLENLQACIVPSEYLDKDKDCAISLLRDMQTRDVLAFLVRPHHSAVILTKQEDCILFESFEVPPPQGAVENATGSLRYSYPGLAVEIANDIFESSDFQSQLADYLWCPDTVNSIHPPQSPHAEYISTLLSSIFQGVGHPVHIHPIVKSVRDDVRPNHGAVPWRRSPLWLLIRVVVQLSLDRSPLGRASYKSAMLFFICTIARDTSIATLSTDLLHLIGCKILRRLGKLRSCIPIPDWLFQIVLKTCACLREILDSRWTQLNTRASPFRNPSQEELVRDARLSLEHSGEYIRKALANCDHRSIATPFHPNHRCRGTIDEFLSCNGSFFDEAYGADPDVTLYDVEKSVEQGIDDWCASVANVEEACTQLEILMDKYMQMAERRYKNPEDKSIMFLTGIELFIAMDRLVVEEAPMLTRYSPEIPVPLLERLLLRKAAHFHRLSCAYQYLSLRHSQARTGCSVLSNEFTEDSFAVRYYDQSPRHQQLRVHLGKYDEFLWESPLPPQLLYAKVIAFELQCPPCIRIWRSAAARMLHYHYHFEHEDSGTEMEGNLLRYASGLQRYFVNRDGPPLAIEIHFAYFHPVDFGFSFNPTLRYIIRHPCRDGANHSRLLIWQLRHYEPWDSWFNLSYSLENGALGIYLYSDFQTPNDVLAAQVECPADLSLDEFVGFGQLRHSGSLQWPNILRVLCSKTLKLRRSDVHLLIASTVFQVGPLDLNTGTWVWHQDLHEPSFSHALLDELENVLAEVGADCVDHVMMSTISLLLTRVLASSPGEDVSERAITLLRRVRKKTFNWVQELSYNLAKAPMNTRRSELLLYMAATCRGTFDADSGALGKFFHSAEDVDAAVSGFLIISILRPKSSTSVSFELACHYLGTLILRDQRLTFALDGILGNVALADPSDYGTDLAVCKIFPSHEPGPNRWQQLQHPNTRWLTCQTKAAMQQASQTLHLNLLDGTLRVNGEQLGGLPSVIRENKEYEWIFCDQGFFVVPSNLPTMDFTTLTAMLNYKVHFSFRDNDVTVRVQCHYSKDVLELVPSRKLDKDLPPALVRGHVHWLNLSSKIIEIRPLERVWDESPENWKINCALGQYHAYKGNEILMDIRSPTWTMISERFSRFNEFCYEKKTLNRESDNLIITTSPVESQQSTPALRLSVALPRYGLLFFMSNGELESRDFKDMVYDENQCVGTLFGLENILVLRQKVSLPEELISRRVLIPTGRLTSSGDRQFQVVYGTASDRILNHTYNVDTELGCLIGCGGLASTQYLAELHSRTSCDRPDPLTGRTGAQAAFCLLQAGGCWSIGMRSKTRATLSYHNPQINVFQEEMKMRCQLLFHTSIVKESSRRAVHRAAHLSPWHTTGLIAPQLKLAHHYDENNPSTSHVPTEHGLCALQYTPCEKKQWHITLEQLLSERLAPELPPRRTLSHVNHDIFPENTSELNQLLPPFPTYEFSSSFHQEYISLLEKSAQRVFEDSRLKVTHRLIGMDHLDTFKKHYTQCRVDYMSALDALKQILGPTTTDVYGRMLHQFGLWPPIAGDTLLRYLASTSPFKLSNQWKKCLISLAMLLLDLQRARRLLRFALDGLDEELSKELENVGCDGWDAEEFPDWLLIQIEGNFLIRRTQAETAKEMISPQSGKNTVMQVNMGEGKSSVIIPIVAAALADGKQLARVIVPKALTMQMFDLLIARLGGLTNRPIYHLPFSRSSGYTVIHLHKLMSQCMAEGGVLLVQPEHVTSFKLKAVEEQIRNLKLTTDSLLKLRPSVYKYISAALMQNQLSEHSFLGNMFRSLSDYYDQSGGNAQEYSDTASKWCSLQRWIHSNIRDILDESDEILHPRFQLIYTIGLQKHMDGYPDRWTITQQILRLVKECAHTLSRNHPDCIEYETGPPGSFPYVRIVSRSSDVGQRLIPLIVEGVMSGRLPSINFRDISDPELRRAIRSFISDRDALDIPDTVMKVEEYAKRCDQSCTWSGLLLLRGLLTSNILLFALTEKRWNVDYGLLSSDSHTMLAVPYRAKDMPTRNTQFGHPDIAIILTCLSYYYFGLTKRELRTSFEILLDEDDPTTEYALWVKDYDDGSIPDSLRTLGEINLKTSEQWDNVIFPLFTRNQTTIDFYLSRVVFPKEAKEYSWKLCASSWDLAEKREKLITGFSGTSDGQWLLPMSIAQHDLEHQQGTNARVLAYLLCSENNFYDVAVNESGSRLGTVQLLKTVAAQKPDIRVLVDVGAQILDLSNEEVAEIWLYIVRNASGAVYFDDDDELMVLLRNGRSVPLVSSPLSQQFDRCVVYLDHAHTRGTDIKFPIGSRAAVTLGPKLTKDSLVQGCMRMRKLGRGHSVMFFAPPEVDASIRAVIGKNNPNARVTTANILCWAIHETWTDIQRWAPHWAQQGMDHKARYEALSRFCNDELTSKQLSDTWLQREQKSLEDLYSPSDNRNGSSAVLALHPGIHQRCKDFGILSLPTTQMDEEQEREVDRQKERERETELPPKAEPAEHSLHNDVVTFVKTGIIPPLGSSSAISPVFTTLDKSSASSVEADVWSPFILATADFCNTIIPESTEGTIDQYLRPAQWILSSKRDRGQVLVLISPFEADRLLPDIRESEYVYLHLYAPRTSKRMKPSDDLALYSIPSLPFDWTPPWALIDQLNLFAGQLYLRDYNSYLRLCHFLGEPTKELRKDQVLAVRRNVLKVPGSFEETEITFSGSPLPSVMALLAIRMRGRPFAHTHMGKILYGQPLTTKDFDGPPPFASDHAKYMRHEEGPCGLVSDTVLPSPLDTNRDPQDDPRPSTLLPSKRGWEAADVSDVAHSEPPHKRQCSDR